MGLKPLPLVLAYFDAFGIFKSHYDLEKSISKKYMLKYIKVYNPALVNREKTITNIVAKVAPPVVIFVTSAFSLFGCIRLACLHVGYQNDPYIASGLKIFFWSAEGDI